MEEAWYRPIASVREELSRLDTSVAHIARIQNYWRGGKDHFAVDREAAEHAMAAYPDLVSSVRANQAFLSRSVRYLAREAGIRQFLDIGTGLPTAGSVHEVAQEIARESRVVYVDNDPIWKDVTTKNGAGKCRPQPRAGPGSATPPRSASRHSLTPAEKYSGQI